MEKVVCPDVFISYNHHSVALADKIAKKLEEDNINCWYAPRNLDDEGAGELYDDIIAKTIPKVRVVVVIITDPALASKWVKTEVTMADDLGKSIIPFEIAPTNIINGLTSRLAIRHKIVAYPNPEEKIGQLIKNVKRKILETTPFENEQINSIQSYEIDAKEPIVDFDFEEGEALYSMKEYSEAAVPYLKSAIQGNSRAKDRLCTMFYHLKDINVITNDVWEIIEPQAKQGHCYACFLMSCKFYNNPQKYVIAYDYLRKAIRANSVPLALLRLGIHYGWGMGVKQSSILSMLYYRKAIDAGCKEAYSYIGSDYLWGNDKYAVDREKGLSYLKKGIELFDKRSMSKLAREYLNSEETIEKAREIANQMIEQEYYDGYCILGDSYIINSSSDEDIKKAENCYLEAVKKDESSAYGSLAYLYHFYGNVNQKNEAIRMAKRGRSEKDSFSLYMLGWIYQDKALSFKEKHDEEKANDAFENAWQCFEERFDVFGVGSIDTARLFLDHGYVPKKYQPDKASNIINKIKGENDVIADDNKEKKNEELVESLISKVEIEFHRGEMQATEILLKLYCFKKYGVRELKYDIINDIPETVSLLAFGANKGENPEMTFYYGKSLLDYDKFPSLYNIGKGLALVERAADMKNSDALNFLIDRYGNIKEHNDNDEKFFYRAKQTIEESVLYKANMKYIGRILSHCKEDVNYKVDIEKIRSLVDRYIKHGDASFLKNIGNSLNILYPNYDEERIFNHYEAAGKAERWLFYSKNFASEFEKDIDLQDDFLEKLHGLVSFEKVQLNDNDIDDDFNINKVYEAMNDYWESYNDICVKNGVTPNTYSLIRKKSCFPYMPPSVCCKISHDTFDLFFSLQKVLPDKYAPMQPILSDDEKMLDYIEQITDEDLQMFLVSYIEIKYEIETVMSKNYELYLNYVDNNKRPIVDYLNALVEKFGDKASTTDPRFTLENLPDISKIKYTNRMDINDYFDYSEEEKVILSAKKDSEEDDFEKLLDDFINSFSSKDDVSSETNK